jgi:hypothetical protein
MLARYLLIKVSLETRSTSVTNALNITGRPINTGPVPDLAALVLGTVLLAL